MYQKSPSSKDIRSPWREVDKILELSLQNSIKFREFLKPNILFF